MKMPCYTEEQIDFALTQAETGTRVEELCRMMGFLRLHFTMEEALRHGRDRSASAGSAGRRELPPGTVDSGSQFRRGNAAARYPYKF